MELREIAAFIQVAQLKSFSKAAKQLGYSQAAVTIQIKQLEQELNVHLFDRIGKQTTLTHQGALFYEHAVSVMKELEHARDAVTHVSELTGSLCLGTIESICATIFPELLREYHRLYPKVNVRLITDSPETLLEMMNSNAIDIVYFLDKRMYDSKWIKVLEEPEDIVFVTASGHPFVGRDSLDLDLVIDQPFILTETKRQLPFHPGPVSGGPGQGDTPLSGDWQHGIHHQPAEKEPGGFLSSGIHHTPGYYQRGAGRPGCQGFLHENLASDCLPQG